LDLIKIGDTTVTPPDDADTVFQMLLIVVASVLGGILAITIITACIQTTKLRRQVKALSINAFGSKESGLHQAGLAVPGSNMYANQGANPIFSLDEKRAPDAESQTSGDSVLIGVEDDPEFRGYAPSSAPQKRPAPPVPVHTNPAFHDDDDSHDNGGFVSDRDVAPAVYDDTMRMPAFDMDEDVAMDGDSPFGGSGGGTTQNPLFGGSGGGSTQNPLFGADL